MNHKNAISKWQLKKFEFNLGKYLINRGTGPSAFKYGKGLHV